MPGLDDLLLLGGGGADACRFTGVYEPLETGSFHLMVNSWLESCVRTGITSGTFIAGYCRVAALRTFCLRYPV